MAAVSKKKSVMCWLDESTDFGGEKIAKWITKKMKKDDEE